MVRESEVAIASFGDVDERTTGKTLGLLRSRLWCERYEASTRGESMHCKRIRRPCFPCATFGRDVSPWRGTLAHVRPE
jgi:hypothetical protein